jgi:MSHA pilin protein MshA
MQTSTQRGFTLIELVVVIVILGILSAFAVPKFMGMETQARISSVKALDGAVRSAAAMAHGLALATGVTNGNVSVEGKNYAVVNGYPATASLVSFLDSSVVGKNVPGKFNHVKGVFTLYGATAPASCSVSYTEPTGPNLAPNIPTPVTTGC